MSLFARPLILPPPRVIHQRIQARAEARAAADQEEARYRALFAYLVNPCEDDAGVLARARVHAPVTVDGPLPTKIVWMPLGRHDISAKRTGGGVWEGEVVCDAKAAELVAQDFQRITDAGGQIWIDLNHSDGEAAAWVRGFSWDPAAGIVAAVEWTPLGEQALREKRFRSFSPAFFLNSDGRPCALPRAGAAGGLVNAPAFGAAMPALAARHGEAEPSADDFDPHNPLHVRQFLLEQFGGAAPLSSDYQFTATRPRMIGPTLGGVWIRNPTPPPPEDDGEET